MRGRMGSAWKEQVTFVKQSLVAAVRMDERGIVWFAGVEAIQTGEGSDVCACWCASVQMTWCDCMLNGNRSLRKQRERGKGEKGCFQN